MLFTHINNLNIQWDKCRRFHHQYEKKYVLDKEYEILTGT